jgi:hypothetical protein
MASEPKPLTEAEWLGMLHSDTPDEIIDFLRERGLIAPEPAPMDALLTKAIELVDECLPHEIKLRHEAIDLALAALRRGMEMRAPLTPKTYYVEEIIDLLQDAGSTSVRMEYSQGWHDKRRDLLTRLHAALTEAQQ